MRVTFYRNASDYKKVNKSLTVLGSADCEVKHDRGVLTPLVIISKKNCPNFAQVNYMHIQGLNRYYYAKVSELPAGMLQIEGNVDVLMSYGSGIRGITCTILRQEHLYNKYYQDDKVSIRATKTITYKTVGVLPSAKTNIITVDGGVNE